MGDAVEPVTGDQENLVAQVLQIGGADAAFREYPSNVGRVVEIQPT
jgi:hypothetical protein